MIGILAALFLGWNLGANDAANIFGIAVTNKIVKFWVAAILSSCFVILGAVMGGKYGVETYQKISMQNDMKVAIIISFAAGISVFIMTTLKIPVSTTHSVLAGLVAAGIFQNKLNIAPLTKILVSWFASPIGSMGLAYLIYRIYSHQIKKRIKNIFMLEKIVKIGILLVGIYGSYSLGANNVANVVGMFVNSEFFTMKSWLILGGFSISLGIITYSKKVMSTVGSGIVKMDNVGALIALLSTAIIIHLYSLYGVPVSSSQAIVGSVIGIGMIEGIENIKIKVILKIVQGWFYSIAISGGLVFLILTVISG